MSKEIEIAPKNKFIFKAIYKKKYIGFFYIDEKTVEVLNSKDQNDVREVPINKCLIFCWTGTICKNKGLLFENDIISNLKGELGVIIFKDCKYLIRYSKNSYVQLTQSLASRISLEGDLILDRENFLVKIKPAETCVYDREIVCKKNS